MEKGKGSLPLGRYSTRGNHDKRFIAQIIQEVRQGKPRAAIYQQYGIKPRTLNQWLLNNKLGIDAIKTKTVVSKQLKRTVVRAFLSGQMTIQQLRQAYGIKSEATVRQWVHQLNQENDELGSINDTLMNKKKPAQTTSNPTEAEVKALQKALADAQLRIAALNTLIDVAEEQLKIDIRKKPGAKQSSD